MAKIFIDSSAFAALYNRKDSHYKEAKDKSLEIFMDKIRIVTSNYVIDETLTSLLARAGYTVAARFGKRLFEEDHDVEILQIDEYVGRDAWYVFKKFNRDKRWKRWSFTDCTSYVFMKNTGIDTVFTFDDDFRQMGFKIL